MTLRAHCGRVSPTAYPRSPPPDRAYDASDAWLVDIVAAALALVRTAAADAESAAGALAALERRTSWEGPAARDFRRRTDALCALGSAAATALDTIVDDTRALHGRLWALTQGAAHGG